MKPHPRIRKTIKWTGLALCLLLAGVWVRSECVLDVFRWSSCAMSWGKGAIAAGSVGESPSSPFHQTYPVQKWGDRVWDVHREDRGAAWLQLCALWIPLAGALFATAAAWRLDALSRRRARLDLCPNCCYDRAGLGASAVCPECGAAPR